MTWRTSALSIPIPKAIVAAIQWTSPLVNLSYTAFRSLTGVLSFWLWFHVKKYWLMKINLKFQTLNMVTYRRDNSHMVYYLSLKTPVHSLYSFVSDSKQFSQNFVPTLWKRRVLTSLQVSRQFFSALEYKDFCDRRR